MIPRGEWSPARVLRLTFVVALGLRLGIIAASPRVSYYNTDLEIYRAGGALVHARVNPYDPRDAVDLRARMREQSMSPTFRFNQASWDYFAAANLPLNLLVFGAIDAVSPHPLAYRVAFALFDAVLAVLVMLYVLRNWEASRREAVVSGGALGAASFVMWQWGVHSPQDKGIELMLIMGAVLLSLSKRRLNRLVFSPCLLGFSVAFKVIGGLLLPLCLVYATARSPRRRSDVAVFSAVFIVAALVWNVPYLSNLEWMLTARVGADVGLPGHASPFQWVFPPEYLLAVTHIPIALQRAWYARIVVGLVLSVLVGVGLARRTLSMETATAALLLALVWIVLVAGGLDRMNIGMVPAILLIGRNHPWARRVAVALYVALGVVSLTMGYALSLHEQRAEALVIAGGLLAMLGFLAYLAIGSRGRAGTDRLRRSAFADDDAPVWPAAIGVCAMLLVVALVGSPRTWHAGPGTRHWQTNPFAASWIFNAARSIYRGGPVPEETMDVPNDRFPSYTNRGPSSATASLTRINEYIIDFVDRVGNVVVTGTMTTSPDNKRLTIEVHGTDAGDAAFRNILVYDRRGGT